MERNNLLKRKTRGTKSPFKKIPWSCFKKNYCMSKALKNYPEKDLGIALLAIANFDFLMIAVFAVLFMVVKT